MKASDSETGKARTPSKSWTATKTLLGFAFIFLLVRAAFCPSTKPVQPQASRPASDQKPAAGPKPLPAKKMTEQEFKRYRLRNAMGKVIERQLLDRNYDVRVGIIAPDPDAEYPENTHLLIRGDQVTRPFVHNLLKTGIGRDLKKGGFIKVSFTKEFIGNVVAEYDVASNTITWKH